MKCPCCGNEMQSGFVRAMGRGGVCWVTENRPMGAAVGCGFGRIFQKLTGEDPGHAPRFLIAGSVAGLAAAFGAPFAGMLFAFEEVKTIVTVPLLLFTGVASFSAWFVITILFGFGLVFPFSSIPSLDWGQMWLPVLFGVGTGLFSALYNTALLRVTEFHDHQKLVPAPLKPLLPFLLSGVLLYVYPQVLVGLGYSTADLGGLTPNGPLLLGSVALLLFVKIIFSILSFASGVPGGLLMPMLAIGSMVGAVGGTLLIGNGFSAEPQLPAYLVLGMAGLFSGTRYSSDLHGAGRGNVRRVPVSARNGHRRLHLHGRRQRGRLAPGIRLPETPHPREQKRLIKNRITIGYTSFFKKGLALFQINTLSKTFP